MQAEEFEFEEVFYSPSNSVKENGASHNSEKEENEDEDEQEVLSNIEALGIREDQKKANLEDFEILKMIGKGGFGKVFLVRRKEDSELYAMKVLRKENVLEHNNVPYIFTERNVLIKLQHPFVVGLYYSFQNADKLYLVMDYLNGGQLFFHLRREAMLSEVQVRFYVAEVVSAIEHLHSLNIIHRDLKPENILLDSDGHVSLTDFGFAKENVLDQTNRTWCGTIEYMAPEMVQSSGHGKAADWWSVGILIYDMLVGQPPFVSSNPQVLQKKILTEKFRFPRFLSQEVCNLLKGLLNRDPVKRLGANGAKEIKDHVFFKPISWKKLINREIPPPFRPEIKRGELGTSVDVSNFSNSLTDLPAVDSPCESKLSESQQKLFHGFSFDASFDLTHDDIVQHENGAEPSDKSQAESGLLKGDNMQKGLCLNQEKPITFTSSSALAASFSSAFTSLSITNTSSAATGGVKGIGKALQGDTQSSAPRPQTNLEFQPQQDQIKTTGDQQSSAPVGGGGKNQKKKKARNKAGGGGGGGGEL